MIGKFFCVSLANSPKISDGCVRPELLAVRHLVKLGNSNSVLVCGHVFCFYVHGDFCKVHIGSDSDGCGDSCFAQNVAYHFDSQLAGGYTVNFQIIGAIDEHLVDRVNVNVFGSDVFEINVVYFGAVFHVVSHSRRSNDEIESQ